MIDTLKIRDKTYHKEPKPVPKPVPYDNNMYEGSQGLLMGHLENIYTDINVSATAKNACFSD